MEADTSNFALGSIICQQEDKEELHPVAFHSFVQRWHFLEGSPHQLIIFSDHKNLAYFQNARVINRRQAQWA